MEKKKFYIVVDVCNGEDYSADDPTILFLGTDEREAKEFFDNEISNWEDGMTDFKASCDEGYDNIKYIYECTDFEEDSHRVMKLVEKELDS